MTRTAPGVWTSPDGYRIIRHTGDDGWVCWRVYRPGATRHCSETAYLREAQEVYNKADRKELIDGHDLAVTAQTPKEGPR